MLHCQPFARTTLTFDISRMLHVHVSSSYSDLHVCQFKRKTRHLARRWQLRPRAKDKSLPEWPVVLFTTRRVLLSSPTLQKEGSRRCHARDRLLRFSGVKMRHPDRVQLDCRPLLLFVVRAGLTARLGSREGYLHGPLPGPTVLQAGSPSFPL